ncbi:MAG TPA: type II secretion system protein GspK [Candidatus Tectomicrobia bacterium]|nr:type II secretion system protein GspK [Candidatus Tectomicrobia bacterium]
MRPATRNGGFALITTLWLVAMLTTVVGLGLATARLGVQTTANRIHLAQGRWAAEACLAIAEARWVQGRLADTGTIDLGQGKACAWRVHDPTARVNVNVAEPQVITALAGSLARVIVERRRTAPFESLEQLRGLSLDSAALTHLTVDGPGAVNVNAASAVVLAALPGMTPEAVDLVLYRRSVGRPIETLDALAGALSPPARATLLANYADLARGATFTAPQLVLTAEGWSGRLGARIELLVVPLPERLAVIRKRMLW